MALERTAVRGVLGVWPVAPAITRACPVLANARLEVDEMQRARVSIVVIHRIASSVESLLLLTTVQPTFLGDLRQR